MITYYVSNRNTFKLHPPSFDKTIKNTPIDYRTNIDTWRNKLNVFNTTNM